MDQVSQLHDSVVSDHRAGAVDLEDHSKRVGRVDAAEGVGHQPDHNLVEETTDLDHLHLGSGGLVASGHPDQGQHEGHRQGSDHGDPSGATSEGP